MNGVCSCTYREVMNQDRWMWDQNEVFDGDGLYREYKVKDGKAEKKVTL